MAQVFPKVLSQGGCMSWF